MFKKTEETEWTRFSKALSPRDREDADEEEEEAPAAASAPAPSQPSARQTTSDVNVSARSAPRASAEVAEEIESTIGEHTSVDGTFKSENSIRIRGTVEGQIESQRAILVEEQANVNAKVTAATVTIAGQVNGEIFCKGRVEIRPSGRVIGQITAGTLIMQEGAFFEGNLKMGGGRAEATTEAPASEPAAPTPPAPASSRR